MFCSASRVWGREEGDFLDSIASKPDDALKINACFEKMVNKLHSIWAFNLAYAVGIVLSRCLWLSWPYRLVLEFKIKQDNRQLFLLPPNNIVSHTPGCLQTLTQVNAPWAARTLQCKPEHGLSWKGWFSTGKTSTLAHRALVTSPHPCLF